VFEIEDETEGERERVNVNDAVGNTLRESLAEADNVIECDDVRVFVNDNVEEESDVDVSETESDIVGEIDRERDHEDDNEEE